MPAGHEHNTRTAIILSIAAFIVLNAVFYVMSGNYFDARRQIVAGVSMPAYSPEQMTQIRVLFAIACGALISVNFLVGLSARGGAHLLAAVLGLANIVAGFASFTTGLPAVLGVSQLVAGLLMPVLAWFSYHHRSRAAWAFVTAICGVFAVVDMFGAPKIGRTLSISLWLALIIPGLYAIAAIALTRLRGDYGERDIAAA